MDRIFALSRVRVGLIDEYPLLPHPVTLGSGLALFAGQGNLKLLDGRSFATGAVILCHQPD